MSENKTLLKELWQTISTALNEIFELRNMSPNAYMEHYNSVERYFKSIEYNDGLLTAAAAAVAAAAATAAAAVAAAAANNPKPKADSEKMETDSDEKILPGGELFYYTKTFFKNYLEKIAEKGNNLEGEASLRFYAKTWGKYQFSSQIANGILTMINRNWVTRQQKDGVKGISDIYTVAMKIWQDIFFKEKNQSLAQTCLRLIDDERRGGRIDALLIRQVVQSYAAAGFVKSEKSHSDSRTIAESLVTYVQYFETQFLEETEQFYKLESNNFLVKNSVNDYAKKVTQRLKEEEDRVKNILHPTTLEKLKPVLERILIQSQLELLQTEAGILLRNEKIEDLHMIFGLINRIFRGNEPVERDLENYIHQVGMDAISGKRAAAAKDPKAYVETIIEVFQKFDKTVKEGFASQQGYTAALDRAFSKLVNNNAVTQEANRSSKSPELLARYCDALLRKGTKVEETDVEVKLNQIMVVFNYIDDKDVFQKFYGKLLAKRLVDQLSASNDYEESMISKLKAACGFEYTSRLQRMFQDITVSTTLVDGYRTYCVNKGITDIVDFSVMVLTSNSWPFIPPPSFHLPIELKRTFESFKNFYTNTSTGRKLEWLYQHSKGELQTLYTKQKYIVQVSTYQMAILLLFNEENSIPVQRILDNTQIERESSMQILLSLLTSKILICAQLTAEQLGDDLKENDVKPDYTIQVDQNFKSKKIKFSINQRIKTVDQKESNAVNQSVEEDRKILIQAAIVRIMKTRKSLKHSLLIQETIPQLTSRFKPQISMIKKCIDMLIEKEYLERDSNEKDLYHYLA